MRQIVAAKTLRNTIEAKIEIIAFALAAICTLASGRGSETGIGIRTEINAFDHFHATFHIAESSGSAGVSEEIAALGCVRVFVVVDPGHNVAAVEAPTAFIEAISAKDVTVSLG